VRYLGFAFLYVIFAVDAVYLFPWALVARTDLGVASPGRGRRSSSGIVLIGLAHAVRRGLLRWM
jgi:NADH-quinone oxidoreductase subunit A